MTLVTDLMLNILVEKYFDAKTRGYFQPYPDLKVT
jgi:hypothetical protein